VTSVVPSPDWNPLLDPKLNARYGEHFAEPVTPMKTSETGGLLGAAAFGPRTGNFAVTLVTVQLADKTVADTDAISMFHARDSIVQSSAYWKSASKSRLSMTKVNEFRHKSAAKHTDSYEKIMATVTDELARQGKWVTGSYKSLVLFVPHATLNYTPPGGIPNWGILGGGFTDSDTSGRVIMPYPSALTNNVVTHEFGHVLGLHHANSLACNNGRSDVPRGAYGWTDSACWSSEYGDTTDLMGFAQPSSPNIGAFLWEYGGFGSGTEILNAGIAAGSKQYTLRPWGGTATNRAVKFVDPASKEVYYLELRVPVGYDTATAVNGNRGVKITKKDVIGWSGNASIVLTPNSYNFGWGNSNLAWQAGQTFTTHAGTKVRIDSINLADPVGSSSARVTVTAPQPAAATSNTEIRFSSQDFNGDGFEDLFQRRADGTLWMSAGTSGPAYAAPVRVGHGWEIFDRVFSVADFNGDRRTDLAARTLNGDLWLYPGNGIGGFIPRVKIGAGWNVFDSVFGVGDTTSDGLSDIAARTPAGTLYIYPGAGAAKFKPRMHAGSGWQGLRAPQGGSDYNGDRIGDIVGRDSAGELKLHRGTGAGTFRTPTSIGSGWGGFTDVLTGQKVNRDGIPDLLARNPDGGLRAYLRNGGGGYLTSLVIGHEWDFSRIIEGSDFDGDRNPDVLAVGWDGRMWLYPGDGLGTFKDRRQIGTGWNIHKEVVNSRDFDRDGKPDLIARGSDGRLWLYPTDGRGKFVNWRVIGTGWTNVQNLIGSKDFDGDGRPDLLARTPAGAMLLHQGNGSGGFLGKKQIGTGWDMFDEVVSGDDFNQDGSADVLAKTAAGQLYLYPGNGYGGWRARTVIAGNWAGFSSLMSTGDFSGGGAPNILARASDGTLILRTADGKGSTGPVRLRAGSL
jgi:hypothetical protein